MVKSWEKIVMFTHCHVLNGMKIDGFIQWANERILNKNQNRKHPKSHSVDDFGNYNYVMW